MQFTIRCLNLKSNPLKSATALRYELFHLKGSIINIRHENGMEAKILWITSSRTRSAFYTTSADILMVSLSKISSSIAVPRQTPCLSCLVRTGAGGAAGGAGKRGTEGGADSAVGSDIRT